MGYGKMGRLIDQLAPEYGFETRLRLDIDNNSRGEGFTRENFKGVDVAVEFSTPSSAPGNARQLAVLGVNAVVGTTGWYEHRPTSSRRAAPWMRTRMTRPSLRT